MREIPVHNDTKHNMHVAGAVIRPGETRLFPEHDVPEKYLPEAKAAEEEKKPEADPIAEIAKGTVAAVLMTLPSLDEEALGKVEAAENEGQKRKGVLEGIAGERLRRAATAATGPEAPQA